MDDVTCSENFAKDITNDVMKESRWMGVIKNSTLHYVSRDAGQSFFIQ